MELISPGINGHAPSDTVRAIDPDLIVRHLSDLLEVTLGASAEELQRKGSLLSSGKRKDTIQRCTRFASEPQVALFVQKALADGQQGNNGYDDLGRSILSL